MSEQKKLGKVQGVVVKGTPKAVLLNLLRTNYFFIF